MCVHWEKFHHQKGIFHRSWVTHSDQFIQGRRYLKKVKEKCAKCLRVCSRYFVPKGQRMNYVFTLMSASQTAINISQLSTKKHIIYMKKKISCEQATRIQSADQVFRVESILLTDVDSSFTLCKISQTHTTFEKAYEFGTQNWVKKKSKDT